MIALIGLLAQLTVPPTVVAPDGRYRTIAAAIAATPVGGTVVVRAGRYREPTIVIDRPLTLTGEPGALLDGEMVRALIIIAADDVTIQGMRFTATGGSFREDRAAVRVEDARRCRLLHNWFDDTFFAVYLATTVDCEVAGNQIRGRPGKGETASGNGIHSWSSRGARIHDNTITGHRDGIYLEFNRDAEVRNNQSIGNFRYGLHFMYSDSSRYINNTFASNGGGVAVMYTKVVTMTGNTFADNGGPTSYGLLLKEIADAHLSGNLFRRNTTGLFADGADRLIATGNRFEENGWGVRLFGSTDGASFVANSFRRNSFDVAVNGQGTSASFSGNWWEGYHGWDLDRDGRGDVAYHPVRLFAVLVEHAQPALLLQRSLFVRLLDAAERVLPVLTPVNVIDHHPLMQTPKVGTE
ncbi:MAG: nitrous oxide reductase family maturation protein NosD [Gemmatimonadota bacterium]